MQTRSSVGRLAGLLLVIALTATAAACGSTPASSHVAAVSGPTTAHATTTIAAATAGLLWDRCMRRHGIPEADPGHVNPPIDQSTARFRSAYSACRVYRVAAEATPGAQQQEQKFRTGLLVWARCMRAHGYPQEDPQFNAQGQVDLMNARASDPRFQRAQHFCVRYFDQAKGAAGASS